MMLSRGVTPQSPGPRPATRLLLVRHGRHEPGGRFYQHGCPGLTEIGVAQARALGAALARDDSFVSPVLLASNAPRAYQTAEILAEAMGIPVTERTCSLCEMHPGAAEGLTQE